MENTRGLSETSQKNKMQARRFSGMRPSEQIELLTSFGGEVLDKYSKMAEEHSKVEHTVLPLGTQGIGIFVPPRGSNRLSPMLRRILSGREPEIEPMLAVRFCDGKAEMTFHPAYAPLAELIRGEYVGSWKEKFGLDLETRIVEVKR